MLIRAGPRAWRQDKGINVDVKWVTIAPGGKFFLPKMGARAAEYYMVRRDSAPVAVAVTKPGVCIS
jgi:hypothetical protein